MSKKSHKALASATVMSLILTSTLTATVSAATGVERLSGSNRETTAIDVATKVFEKSETVVLVNGYKSADALSATPLAKAYNAPILSVGAVDEPSAALLTSLKDLGAKKVIVVGGEGAVTKALATKLAETYTVERIEGKDRYATNVNVAKKVMELKASKEAFVVNGSDASYADALSIASIAASKGAPIVFTNGKTVSEEAKALVKDLKVAAIGGTGVVSAEVLEAVNATRVGGADRFETNLEVLKAYKDVIKLDNVFVAYGLNFADALVASAAAAKTDAPVVLADKTNTKFTKGATDYIEANKAAIKNVYLVGGTGVIADSVKSSIDRIVNPVVTDLKVESVEAINRQQIEVKFNKELDEDSAKETAYYVLSGDVTVIKHIELSADKRVVTITLNSALVNQTGKVTLTIAKDIKDAEGNKLGDDFTQKDIKFVDTVLPTIDSVEVVGNRKLTVKYSEPVVSGADIQTSYMIDGKLFSATNVSLDTTKTGRVVDIQLSLPLSAGQHTLKLSANKVADLTGLKNLEVEKTFVVEDVKTAPTASVIKATNTEVKVKFEREIKAVPTIKFGSTTASVKQDDTDKTVYIATFGTGIIPNAGGTLTIVKGIEDFYGNKTTEDIKLSFAPNIDTVKPAVVGMTSDKEGKIVVEFSEDVKNPAVATVSVKDKDGKSVSSISVSYAKTESGKDIKNKVLIASANFKPENSPYKVSIKGVKDLADNPMDAVTDYEVVVIDTTAPTVSGSAVKNVTNNKLSVTFSEKVDPNTAVDVANYKYEKTSSGIYALPSGTTAELSADGKSVTFTLPSTWKQGSNTTYWSISDIASLYMSNIKDLSGNVMSDRNVVVTGSETLSTIKTVEATDSKTVVLEYNDDNKVLPSVLYAGDFIVFEDTDNDDVFDATEKTFTVSNATISSRKITLTLANEIPADVQSNGNAVKVVTKATGVIGTSNDGTKTPLGNDFIVACRTISDKIAPAIDKDNIDVIDDGTLTVKLPLTEALAAKDAGAILVKAGDKVLTPGATGDYTVTYNTVKPEFVIVFNGKVNLTKTISVSIPDSTTLLLNNDGTNSLKPMEAETFNFDLTKGTAGKFDLSTLTAADYKVVDGVTYIKQASVPVAAVVVQQADGTAIDVSTTVVKYNYTSKDGNNWASKDATATNGVVIDKDDTTLNYFLTFDGTKLTVVKYQVVVTLP